MKNVSWNDGLGSAGRTPKLSFVLKGEIHPFAGQNIPGVVTVLATKYEKNGKWSNTTYTLAIADDAGVWDQVAPMHQGTWDGQATLEEALARFVQTTGKIVAMAVFEKYMASAYPKALERMKQTAQALGGMTSDVEVIEYSFGSPTNRAISEGYWSSPKQSPLGEISLKGDGNWQTAQASDIICPPGVVVTQVRRSPGMHGGYVSVYLAKKG